MKPIENGVNLSTVPLKHAEFWVQIHDLPRKLSSEGVMKDIGNLINEFVEAEKTNNDGT